MKKCDRDIRDSRIIELRREGLTQIEIAEAVGCTANAVGYTLRKAGIYGPSERGIENSKTAAMSSQKKQYMHDLYVNPIEKVIETVDRWSGGKYEYVSGYTGSDCKVIVRCKECGAEAERSFISMRKGKPAKKCSVCVQREETRRKNEQRAERENERAKRKQENVAKRIAWEDERRHACPTCGAETTRQVYCSNECRKKADNHKAEANRRAKLKAALVDSDIEIHKLYDRDNGICYLCGRPCDWEDAVERNGAIVCGGMYPSVDHVIPLAKGGLHSWDNVRLAHRVCNTRKSDKVIRPHLAQGC